MLGLLRRPTKGVGAAGKMLKREEAFKMAEGIFLQASPYFAPRLLYSPPYNSPYNKRTQALSQR